LRLSSLTLVCIAAFAYGGIELSALAAAESKNPRRDIPKATKQVFWRIAFIYVLLLFLLTLVVSSSDDRLVNASGGNSKASPFVIAMVDANIKALPSIFNVIIVLAVISVANACAYGSTRSLQALAARGMAPSFFAKIDKQGRPIWCVLLQVLFGFLAYLNASVKKETVFSWLLAISGLASLIVWASICLAHIRFRAGWRNAGRSLEALPYRAAFGVWGSYYGLLLNILALAASFYSALFVSSIHGFVTLNGSNDFPSVAAGKYRSFGCIRLLSSLSRSCSSCRILVVLAPVLLARFNGCLQPNL